MSNPNGELKTSSELSLLSEEKLDETDQIEDERWGSGVEAPPRSPPIQSQLVQNIGTPSKIPASPASTRPHLQSPARVLASPNVMSPTSNTFEFEDSDPPDEKYLQELRGLPAERVAAKINDLVRIHLQLLIEEGKEIQKGKMLNILNTGTTSNGGSST